MGLLKAGDHLVAGRALFGSWYEFFPRSEGARFDEAAGAIGGQARRGDGLGHDGLAAGEEAPGDLAAADLAVAGRGVLGRGTDHRAAQQGPQRIDAADMVRMVVGH